ncbi:MAG: phytanoyl-CoA dioxygenase family protein [Myxococcota bacterium]
MKTLFPPIDFDAFHRDVLPARIAAGHGALAARAITDLPPLAFRLPDGRAYTFVPRPGGVELRPGVEGAGTLVDLSLAAWEAFVHEIRTLYRLYYTGELAFARGDFEALNAWEPALRALFHGRPVFDAATLDLRDRSGDPLDLQRAFTLDDDDEDMRHFLREAGFLHVRGVFSREEIEAMRAEASRLAEAARPGDRNSWWAITGAGETTLCRVNYAGLASPRLGALEDDPRVRRLATLGGEVVRAVPDRMDGTFVLFKLPDAREGMADLPWHVDCGFGGHSVFCPSVLVGVQLDAATPETGQLLFVPGSWRTACRQVADPANDGMPVVAVETAVGDCTVHMGDALHAAPSPKGTGPARRTLYVQFYHPAVFGVVEPGTGFNDVIFDQDAVVPKSRPEAAAPGEAPAAPRVEA